MKELDETATPEEMAQAVRSIKQARTASIVVGLVVAVIAFLVIGATFGESPLAIIVLVVVAVGAYWLTNEILVRILPPH